MNERAGICLLGGNGKRFNPNSLAVSKQLHSLYSKPLCYYSLSILFLSSIRDILIISTPKDLPLYKDLFKDGSQFGVKLSYLVQKQPNGIAEAFLIGEKFINNRSVCLVLGDNILWSMNLSSKLKKISQNYNQNTIFGYYVQDPQRFGVPEFNENGKLISIEEKPQNPKSSYAIIGLYYYNNNIVNMAKKLKPSKRGELEISHINQLYLEEKNLEIELFRRGVYWTDSGTIDSFLSATNFIAAIEKNQGLMIGNLDEIAYNQKWITKKQLLENAEKLGNNEYSNYLRKIANE